MRKLIAYQYTDDSSSKRDGLSGVKLIKPDDYSFTAYTTDVFKERTFYLCKFNKFFFDDGTKVVKEINCDCDRDGFYMQSKDILEWLVAYEQEDSEVMPELADATDLFF